MVKTFKAELNKVYFVNKYTMIHILNGTGQIQVDFKNYNNWNDKVIFLDKGQFIKFLSDDFELRTIEFPDEIQFRSRDVRILFKHLISLGYINYNDCEDCKKFLDQAVFNRNLASLIDVSTKQWYWQNPFNADKDEYTLIFDIKAIIDSEFTSRINTDRLIGQLENSPLQPHRLIKDKLGISVKNMVLNKQFLESRKEVVFSDKTIQEIAYDKGYKDPAYFNRVFKNRLGHTPGEYRKSFDYSDRDTFARDLIDLIKAYHRSEHRLGFYADQMHLSVKTLSHKVRVKLNTTLGQLIRSQIIHSAKKMLRESESVKEVAYALGFEEANHFSSFFAKYTGQSPSEFNN